MSSSPFKFAAAVAAITGGAVLLHAHLLTRATTANPALKPATLGETAASFMDTLGMGAQFIVDGLSEMRNSAAAPAADAGTESRDSN